MNFRRYEPVQDEQKLMQLIHNEGEDWSCYWAEAFAGQYKKALSQSITFVAYEGDVLCGYSRSIDDCGFYIYICDLLVHPDYRGRNIGRRLMNCVTQHYPEQTVYVMSDVDDYYIKQGFHREGSVFEVIPSPT